jgi:hypothetical protein
VFGRLSLERREYFTSKLNDEPREQQTQKEESPAVGTWLAMGICFGAAFGSVFGNTGAGLAMGISFGICIGAAMDARARKNA